MAYSLRLPEILDIEARVRAQRLGISLNALVCVALDAYLQGPVKTAPEVPTGPVGPVAHVQPQPMENPEPVQPASGLTRRQRRELEHKARLAAKRG
jgi:hypothetical protein